MPRLLTYVVNIEDRKLSEPFKESVLFKSVVNACLSAGSSEGQAKSVAERVVGAVVAWLKDRPEVTTHDIRRVTARSLKVYHPDASYLYEHHRVTL